MSDALRKSGMVKTDEDQKCLNCGINEADPSHYEKCSSQGSIYQTQRRSLNKAEHSHTNVEMHDKPGAKSCMAAITPFVLMLALGVHSMFEGIALGLMQQMNQTINLIISIVIHKVAETISISIALNKSFNDFKTVLRFLFLYAFITPIGTTIGILLGDGTSELVYLTFMSLACGTFFYVSCSELVVEEFSLPGNRWFKLLAFCIASLIMGLLLLLD